MLQSIWQDVQQQFRHGNMVTQIILVNIAVFIAVNVLRLIGRGIPGSSFDETIINFFSLSSDWLHNLTHPWSIITYGFLHQGLGHIFWNMLLFYWFGRIVGDLIGNQRILPLYIWGVIVGGLVYWLSAVALPYSGGSFIVGASAGVMATIVAAAFIAPEYSFRLILIGEVKLKYIALTIILIDIFAFGTDGNTGGHFAHLGGMVMGYLFVSQLRNGQDLAVPINRVGDSIMGFFRNFGESKPKRRQPARALATGKSRRQASGTASAKTNTAAEQAAVRDKQQRLDAILEKIKAKGIDSLSVEEREFLSLQSRDR